MPNSFKLCPTHFSRGGEKFSRGATSPWLRAWCVIWTNVVTGNNDFDLDQTLTHAFWVCVSFPEVQSSEEAGCTDVQIAWPLWVRVFKRTAMITQAGVGSHTLHPVPLLLTIALRHLSCVHICISKGNYRKVSCLGEHNTQGNSPSWVNKQGNYMILPITASPGDCISNVIAELTL